MNEAIEIMDNRFIGILVAFDGNVEVGTREHQESRGQSYDSPSAMDY